MNPSKAAIFRAYDIRGIFGEDLTVEIAEDIGRAFGTYVGGGDLAVGRDNRMSSDALRDALIRGILATGCNVMDVGVVPTPLLYFSIAHYKKDGGIMITGSHNPSNYNGFKMCRGSLALYGDEIQEIRQIIDSGNFRKGSGSLKKSEIIDTYIGFVKEKIDMIDIDRAKPKNSLRVVIDAGNGTGGLIAPRLFNELGCDVIKMYCEPDGNFPNHPADPTVDEYLNDLIAKVKDEGANLGIAYDGDSDRVVFVDDTGSIIRGDQSLILFSREVLMNNPGAKIIFEVKCSQALAEDIKKQGGIPIMYRTGHSFIKKKMKEENALLAGEMSGHFFFADNYYGYDDGIFTSARMVEIVVNSGKDLSELMSDIPRYHSTPEIRLPCPEDEKFGIVDEITKALKERYGGKYEVITVDGVRIQFDYGWGLLRASNTEPALILRFEAKSEEGIGEIKKIITDELMKFPSVAAAVDTVLNF